MNEQWDGQDRIDIAKEVLKKSVTELDGVENIEIGLRVYGHQSPITATYQDCNDTKLEVPFGPSNAGHIKARISSIRAKGTTPIARSLEAAAGDFPDTNSRNIIILITDGQEACDNDPCIIAKKLKDKGVRVTPFVIGLGMDLSYLEKFSCIGTFMEAETKSAFENVMDNIIQKAVLNTSVQINLNDIYGKPSETNVAMFLYEAGTNNLKYTFEHTLNRYGNPDTLTLDPEIKYDLVVNTIPEVRKENIEIQKFRHNVIEVDAPQGFIKITYKGARNPIPTAARISGPDGKTINWHVIGREDKYIVGKYEVEVFTYPKQIYEIDVKQSRTEYISIPAPGILRYNTPIRIVAQLFVVKDDGSLERVYNFEPGDMGGDLQLLPGTYRVVHRPENAQSTAYTTEVNFRIFSNKITPVQL